MVKTPQIEALPGMTPLGIKPNAADPYVLSIEYGDGTVKQHGFHLGTDVRLAKQIAEEKFWANNDVHNLPDGVQRIISLALIRKGEKTAYYDFRGEWSR